MSVQDKIAKVREVAEARNWSREATEREIARVLASKR
jgi:hypothetical protein